MALKRKIAKAEYDKLDKVIQGEYTLTGDDYVLDVEGFDDPDELRRAHDRTKQEVKDLKNKVKEKDTEIADLKKSGGNVDVVKLEKEWQDKLDAATGELKTKLDKVTGHSTKTVKESFANSLAAKISTAPSLMSRVIMDRLNVEVDEDTMEPKLVIVGSDGKTKITADQLEKELTKNKEYASIIVGSRATGSGGADKREPSSGGAASPENSNVDWSKAKPADLRERLLAKHGKAKDE